MKTSEMLRLSTRTIVQVPHVPNFLEKDGRYVEICSFNNTELEAVGERWTANLIKRAHDQRIAKMRKATK